MPWPNEYCLRPLAFFNGPAGVSNVYVGVEVGPVLSAQGLDRWSGAIAGSQHQLRQRVGPAKELTKGACLRLLRLG